LIFLAGYSRHGKGEVSQILGSYFGWRAYSSSWVARVEVYGSSPLLQREWRDPDHAWENRHYNRKEWYNRIQAINRPCKTTLAETLFSMPHAYVYDGIRDREELRACMHKWPDALSVWVYRPSCKEESSESCTVRAADCDFVIMNSGTLPDLQRRVKKVFERIRVKEPRCMSASR